MVWFKGFLRGLPVKVEFTISQMHHAVSYPWAFVPSSLLEMPFFNSKEEKGSTQLCHPPRPRSSLLPLVPRLN